MMIFSRILGAGLLLGTMVLMSGCESDKPAGAGTIPAAWDEPDGTRVPGSGNAPGWNTASNETPGDWGAGGDVDERTGVRRVNVEGFPVVVYFGYDTDRINASETPKLDQVAGYLKSQPNLVLVIEGHCDERGTEEYNRALGERRAIAVENMMASHGLDLARIRTVSYGEDKPAVAGSGEEAWSKNRRAELWVGAVQ